jgi:2-dehydropantoate 2-reductase
MRVVVIGGGALGSLLAAKLAPLVDLWLATDWAEHVAAIRERGLILVELDGSETLVPVQVVEDPDAVAHSTHLALIAVKSHATAQAAAKAGLMLAGSGLALTLQNGLGNREILASVLGAPRVVQGVTSMGATLLGPGRVRYAGAGTTYLAGEPGTAGELATMAQLLQRAQFETYVADDVTRLVWGKLVINAGINALTAILRVSNGVLLEQPAARSLMAAAALEAASVAVAKGIALPYDDPVAQVEQVARATAANRSSMLQDILRQAPTEIEVINGAIAREGERHGVPTPVNQVLADLVRAVQATYSRKA